MGRGRSLPVLEAGSYRGAFLGALTGREATLAGGAVRVLAGFLLNKSVDSDLLDAAGKEKSTALPFPCHAAPWPLVLLSDVTIHHDHRVLP